MDKEGVVCTYNGILLNNKKEKNKALNHGLFTKSLGVVVPILQMKKLVKEMSCPFLGLILTHKPGSLFV